MSFRVLQFFSTLDNGGAENRMMDAYREINSDIVTFDFAVLHNGKHHFDDEVKAKGSEKYVLPDPRAGLLKNYKALVSFFKEHDFQAVHAHVAWYCGIVLLAAKRAGVKIRIAHARGSASPERSLKEHIICNIGKILIALSATHKMAISEEAAENVFGKSVVKKGKHMFVPNAIDQKKYVVLEQTEKNKLRAKLGIPSDKKAYVTVANLRKAKNHKFLLEVAKELKNKGDNFILYLIGDGDLRPEIEKKIKELDLNENVVLMGTRGDVPEILCVFDGMIFPSLYEGLGGVVLEAQLVGVPAIVSEAIPKVVDVGIDMVEFLPFDDISKWAEIIMKKTDSFKWNREKTLKAFEEKEYTIEATTKKYLKEYGIPEDVIKKAMIK